MSLGWQGESALLPKRAKAIAVDSTSMQSLRAEVMDEQQKRRQRQQDGRHKHDRGGVGLRQLRGASGSGKRDQPRTDVFSRENRGVREREARDKVQEQDGGGSARRRTDKVTLALQAKEKIYNQLQGTGREGDELDGGAAACQDVLVDFALKRELQGSAPQHWQEQHEHREVQDGYSDIEDEFGRERRVLRSSEAYQSWLRRKRESGVETGSRGLQKGRSDAAADFMEEHREQRARAREFVTEVRHEVRQQQEESAGRGGGVRSQWDEKVLRGQEREHLQALHQQTQLIRQQQAGSVIAQAAVDDAGLSGKRSLDDSSRSNVAARSSAADKRREMLLQKQLKFKKQKLDEDNK
mmetsp:Transcript_2934/g.5335  ORF Transcript_2934/g.5335 Transcript_2934/m.5335 type:complete len:353 (-) Transcript_2934:1342-2400(-)